MDAAHRNYRDPYAKPELLCALAPFEALCGFREPARSAALLDGLGVGALGPVAGMLRGGGIHEAVSALLDPAADHKATVAEVAAACARDPELAWAAELAGHYPGDPGVVIALLMHRVRLAPGEALYVPAGQPHSYLRGVGVEIMGASDNVLRGGLTGKHVDVPELLRILSPSASEPALVRPSVTGGVAVYRTPAREFELSRIDVDGEMTLGGRGPRILLCVAGSVRVQGADSGSGHDVMPGESVFSGHSSGALRLSGAGTLFRATTPVEEVTSSSRSETSRSF